MSKSGSASADSNSSNSNSTAGASAAATTATAGSGDAATASGSSGVGVSGIRPGITMRMGETINNERRIESNQAWIRMSTSRFVRDGKNLYGVTFKAKNGVEWSVLHRFNIYRRIHQRVRADGYRGPSPFPPTFMKSKFGVKLKPDELDARAAMLSEVRGDLVKRFLNYVVAL